MVKKVTLLELHLDDARFTKTTGDSRADDEMRADDPSRMDEMSDMNEMDEVDEMSEIDESAGRSIGRMLKLTALGVVVAVGIRTIARRFLGDDETMEEEMMGDGSMGESPVEVDLDDAVDA